MRAASTPRLLRDPSASITIWPRGPHSGRFSLVRRHTMHGNDIRALSARSGSECARRRPCPPACFPSAVAVAPHPSPCCPHASGQVTANDVQILWEKFNAAVTVRSFTRVGIRAGARAPNKLFSASLLCGVVHLTVSVSSTLPPVTLAVRLPERCGLLRGPRLRRLRQRREGCARRRGGDVRRGAHDGAPLPDHGLAPRGTEAVCAEDLGAPGAGDQQDVHATGVRSRRVRRAEKRDVLLFSLLPAVPAWITTHRAEALPLPQVVRISCRKHFPRTCPALAPASALSPCAVFSSSRPRASLDDLRQQEAELRKEQKAIISNDRLSSRNRRARGVYVLHCSARPCLGRPCVRCLALQVGRTCRVTALICGLFVCFSQDLAQIEYKLGKIREDKGEIKRVQREEKARAARAAGRGVAAAAAAEAAGASGGNWGVLGSWWGGGSGKKV